VSFRLFLGESNKNTPGCTGVPFVLVVGALYVFHKPALSYHVPNFFFEFENVQDKLLEKLQEHVRGTRRRPAAENNKPPSGRHSERPSRENAGNRE